MELVAVLGLPHGEGLGWRREQSFGGLPNRAEQDRLPVMVQGIVRLPGTVGVVNVGLMVIL